MGINVLLIIGSLIGLALFVIAGLMLWEVILNPGEGQ